MNAAGEGFAPKPVEELDEADWDAAFGATAKGSFFVSQAAAPHLRASRGCVVMIEDVAGYQPWPSFAAHSAAKAAQAMLTRVLARALAPEVRVCGVAPGPVAVEPGQEERRAAETLLGRIGSPDDVAERGRLPRGAPSSSPARRSFVDGGRSAPNQPGSGGVEVPMDLALDALRLPRAAEAATMPAVAVERLHRRRADPPHRRRRPRCVRGALPSLRSTCVRPGAPKARRPRPRRGRGSGDVRLDLAGGPQLPARARPRRPLALRGRAQRDRRPQPSAAPSRPRMRPTKPRPIPARPSSRKPAGPPGESTGLSRSSPRTNVR